VFRSSDRMEWEASALVVALVEMWAMLAWVGS
jgi:hypothetical protein